MAIKNIHFLVMEPILLLMVQGGAIRIYLIHMVFMGMRFVLFVLERKE